ncbi:MAG: phosphate acyltransferase, partial [Dolichospermum sp.]
MGSTGVRIAIDAMGGDHAPDEIVAGALRAREELGVKILLVGDPQRIEAVIPPKTNMADLEIVTAKEAIAILIEDSRLRLTALRGSSSIAIASLAVTISKSAILVFGG